MSTTNNTSNPNTNLKAIEGLSGYLNDHVKPMIESNKQQDKSSHDSIIESINETLKVINPDDENYIYKKHLRSILLLIQASGIELDAEDWMGSVMHVNHAFRITHAQTDKSDSRKALIFDFNSKSSREESKEEEEVQNSTKSQNVPHIEYDLSHFNQELKDMKLPFRTFHDVSKYILLSLCTVKNVELLDSNQTNCSYMTKNEAQLDMKEVFKQINLLHQSINGEEGFINAIKSIIQQKQEYRKVWKFSEEFGYIFDSMRSDTYDIFHPNLLKDGQMNKETISEDIKYIKEYVIPFRNERIKFTGSTNQPLLEGVTYDEPVLSGDEKLDHAFYSVKISNILKRESLEKYKNMKKFYFDNDNHKLTTMFERRKNKDYANGNAKTWATGVDGAFIFFCESPQKNDFVKIIQHDSNPVGVEIKSSKVTSHFTNIKSIHDVFFDLLRLSMINESVIEDSGSNYENIQQFSAYLNGRSDSSNETTQSPMHQSSASTQNVTESEFTKFLRKPLLTRFEIGLSYYLSKLNSESKSEPVQFAQPVLINKAFDDWLIKVLNETKSHLNVLKANLNYEVDEVLQHIDSIINTSKELYTSLSMVPYAMSPTYSPSPVENMRNAAQEFNTEKNKIEPNKKSAFLSKTSEYEKMYKLFQHLPGDQLGRLEKGFITNVDASTDTGRFRMGTSLKRHIEIGCVKIKKRLMSEITFMKKFEKILKDLLYLYELLHNVASASELFPLSSQVLTPTAQAAEVGESKTSELPTPQVVDETSETSEVSNGNPKVNGDNLDKVPTVGGKRVIKSKYHAKLKKQAKSRGKTLNGQIRKKSRTLKKTRTKK